VSARHAEHTQDRTCHLIRGQRRGPASYANASCSTNPYPQPTDQQLRKSCKNRSANSLLPGIRHLSSHA
jgi:hypothetical protein